MIAVFVNMGTVLLGSLLGILLRNRLKESFQNALIKALALCTVVIGVSTAIGTKELLCVILSMALGTALGELLHIDDGIEHAGDAIKNKLFRGKTGNSRFTEGFVSACIPITASSMPRAPWTSCPPWPLRRPWGWACPAPSCSSCSSREV